ncbi:MAG: RNA polymerase sigma factor [Verrucomicrobiales bacterium]
MPAIDPENPTDHSEVMLRLVAGDDHALDVLMERWKVPLISFLLRMTNDSTVAGDLAQETFVRLYLARDRYRPSGKFSTYLFTIASNLARNHFRFAKRHPAVSFDDTREHAETGVREAVDPGRNASETTVGKEREKEILAAIASLPEDQREAITLCLMDDFPIAEIAAIMGCNEKAVDNKLNRGRQRLREKLKHLLG